MPKIIRFWDFDLTLTAKHTFKMYARGIFPEGNEAELDLYKRGQEEFEQNCKEFPDEETLFAHDDEHNLSAVATFHNNPSFIAGFISKKLNRELTPLHTIYSDTDPVVALTAYQADGLNTPFLISWIPASGKAFNETINKLQTMNIYKSYQLSLLRQNLISEHIEKTAVINFYDDSVANIRNALLLPFPINGYFVNSSSSSFSIIESFSQPDYREEEAKERIPEKAVEMQSTDSDLSSIPEDTIFLPHPTYSLILEKNVSGEVEKAVIDLGIFAISQSAPQLSEGQSSELLQANNKKG